MQPLSTLDFAGHFIDEYADRQQPFTVRRGNRVEHFFATLEEAKAFALVHIHEKGIRV